MKEQTMSLDAVYNNMIRRQMTSGAEHLERGLAMRFPESRIMRSEGERRIPHAQASSAQEREQPEDSRQEEIRQEEIQIVITLVRGPDQLSCTLLPSGEVQLWCGALGSAQADLDDPHETWPDAPSALSRAVHLLSAQMHTRPARAGSGTAGSGTDAAARVLN